MSANRPSYEELQQRVRELEMRVVELEATTGTADGTLSDQSTMYKTIFHLSPVAIGLTRFDDGTIYQGNDAYFEEIGYSREEAIGRTTVELGFWANPGDRDRIKAILLDKGSYHKMELPFRKKDGTIYHVMQSAELVTIGDRMYIIGVHINITHLKQLETDLLEKTEEMEATIEELNQSNDELNATVEELEATNEALIATQEELRTSHNEISAREERFRFLTERLNDIVFILNTNGEITYSSPNVVSILGYSVDDVSTAPFRDFVHPDDYPIAAESFARHMRGETYVSEFRVRKKSGEYCWVRDSARPIVVNGAIAYIQGTLSDITDRKNAETALMESEFKYRIIFEHSPLGILHFDVDGAITACNDTFVSVIGSSREKLIGLNMLNLPDTRVAAAVREAIAGGRGQFEGEYRSVTADKVTPVRTLFEAIVGPDGAFLGGVGIIEDVSERATALAALRESEERFRSLVEAAPYGIVVHIDGRAVYANTAAITMIGFESLEDIVGGSIIEQVHPDDRAMVVERLQQQLKPGEALPPIEERLITKSGDIIVCEVDSILADYQGRTAVFSFVNNITDRKAIESALMAERERLAVTLRSIGDGVIATDAAGRVTLLNKVAEDFTGWTAAEAMGRHIAEVFVIVNEFSREPAGNPIDRVLASDAIVGLANHTMLLSRDGRERIIADSGAPIRDRSSRIVGAVLVFRDITDKQRMEMELHRNQRLESIGVLAGGIAHDFNNILTAIVGNITLARLHETDRSPSATVLAEAEKAALRAKDLTLQLLTFSKGGHPIKKVVALAGIIRDAASFVLRGSKVRCEFELADDLWAVEADEGQIGQVIQNLVINAMQSMPDGGIVRIVARNESAPSESVTATATGPYVRIDIIDRGGGIPPEVLPRVFDPYFSTKETGSGLGLSVVHSIVTKHDGLVGVTSQIGSGSTFSVRLPACGSDLPVPCADDAPAPVGTGRILIMDDEEPIRTVAQRLLEKLGYEVQIAQNGEEAIELFRAARQSGAPMDLALLDLTVPGGMGGLECLHRLRDIDPDVPAIVSSGYSNDPIMAEHRRHGFDGCIVKPFRMQELSDAIRRLIRPARS
ncbi:MAG TPA: PAS domain S-box protein [Spirochaetota bacterium]|nr:PAS domain S-box protein [Spirochaetota bacterium]HNT10983.1 PAS domain S-box protein [Spirochaetota bacterium]